MQRLRDLAYTLVADLASGEGEGLQVEETLGDVDESLVADFVAKRDVQGGYPATTLSQVSHTYVRDVVAGSEVELAQAGHPGEVFNPGIGDAHAEREIYRLERGQADRYVPKRLVAEPLAILETEVLQREVSVGGLAIQSGQMGDALIRYVPAASQIETSQSLETPGDQEEAGVGDIAATAEFQVLEVLQVLGYPAEGRVGHLFAEGKIELGQRGVFLTEGVGQTGVGDVVAAGEIEGLEIRYSLQEIAEAPSQGQDLYVLNSSPGEAGEQRRGLFPQM